MSETRQVIDRSRGYTRSSRRWPASLLLRRLGHDGVLLQRSQGRLRLVAGGRRRWARDSSCTCNGVGAGGSVPSSPRLELCVRIKRWVSAYTQMAALCFANSHGKAQR